MTGRLAIVRAAVAPTGPSARPALAAAETAASDDILVAVFEAGGVTAFCGHVDLGTGIRTALAQIVAEELDVPFADVTMVLGHTDQAPNQGGTIASETIQVTAIPLRKAAAQARIALLELASDMTGLPVAAL